MDTVVVCSHGLISQWNHGQIEVCMKQKLGLIWYLKSGLMIEWKLWSKATKYCSIKGGPDLSGDLCCEVVGMRSFHHSLNLHIN